jgi:hypothetical protein
MISINQLKGLLMSSRLLHCGLLIIVMLAVCLPGLNRGEFWHSDAARHAMNGVFVADYLKDRPADIIKYAQDYSAHYPALSLVYHAPFFPLVEGLFFKAAGISAATARSAVMVFALVFIMVWYLFTRSLFGAGVALYASLLICTTPYMVLLSREVLLELPVLAMSALSMCFFYRFTSDNRERDFWLWLVFLVLAVLTKQTAVFLTGFCVVYLAAIARTRTMLTPTRLAGVVLYLGLLGGMAWLTSRFAPSLLHQSYGDWGGQSRLSLANWLYYFRVLPRQITWWALTGGLAGVALFVGAVLRSKAGWRAMVNRPALFFILWLVCCYVFFSLVSVKYPRHTVYWIPVWLLFTALFIRSIPWRPVRWVMGGLILAGQIYDLSQAHLPYIKGYQEAARMVVKNLGAGNIFFDGYYDGNFIFQVRALDTWKNTTVVRANHTLVEIPVMTAFGGRELTHGAEAIARIIQEKKIDCVIVEERPYYHFKIHQELRAWLESGNAVRQAVVPLATNIEEFKNNALIVYTIRQER